MLKKMKRTFIFYLVFFMVIVARMTPVQASGGKPVAIHNYQELLAYAAGPKSNEGDLFPYDDFGWPSEPVTVTLSGIGLYLSTDWVIPKNVTIITNGYYNCRDKNIYVYGTWNASEGEYGRWEVPEGLVVENGGCLVISGRKSDSGWASASSLTVMSGGSVKLNEDLNIYNTVTLGKDVKIEGNGVLRLWDDTIVKSEGATLSGLRINSSMDKPARLEGDFTITGSISIVTDMGLTIAAGSTVSLEGPITGEFQGNGTITVESKATLNLKGKSTRIGGNVIQVKDGGTLEGEKVLMNGGGSIVIDKGAVFHVGTLNLPVGTVTINGQMNLSSQCAVTTAIGAGKGKLDGIGKIYLIEKGYILDKIGGHVASTLTIDDGGNHRWTVTVTRNATCTKTGTGTRICSQCRKQEAYTIEKTDHTAVKDPAVAATTTKTGLTEGSHCSVCGKVLTAQKTVPKLTKPASTVKPSPKSALNVKGTLPLQVKKSVQIKAVNLAKGDAIASCASSNRQIATITSKGKLTAKSKTGTATIKVTLKSKKVLSFKVKVQKTAVKTTKLTLNTGKTLNLKKGKTFTLKPTLTPISSKEKVTYKTSNRKIATVNSKGVIKGIKKGKATVTVKAGKKSVKVTVKVV